MKLLLIILSVFLVSCSSNVKRTKKTDKTMRVMIDPVSASGHYINVQTALVSSGAFVVVDRSNGFRALTQEQDRAYKHQSDRFSNNQKFAHYGKLYGVGAVVVAKAQCRYVQSLWRNTPVQKCKLFLNLVDANTGEVVVGIRDEAVAERLANPDWENAVDKLISVYPEYFTKEKLDERLQRYMDESEENYKQYEQRQVHASGKRYGYQIIQQMGESEPTQEPVLPHDDNFDENGKALNAEEVLKRVNKKALKDAGVSY